MRHLTRRFVFTASLFALSTAPAMAQNRRIRIFAASSLQAALDAFYRTWSPANAQWTTTTYDSSAALARQLDNGAPADLYLSADTEWMDWVEKRGLVQPATRRNLAGNTLVLITAQDQPESPVIASGFPLAEAIGSSRLAMGLPDSVPAGRYAKAALTTLGVWNEVVPKIAGASSARGALALVARGEAKFGIVFGSDALEEPRVRVVGTFPASTHPAIVYVAALTANASHPAAQQVLDALASPMAKSFFEAAGFSVLGGGK